MQKRILVILGLFLSLCAWATNPNDSLLTLLKKNPHDTTQLYILHNLIKNNIYSDPQMSLGFAKKYLKVAHKVNAQKEICLGNNFVGMVYYTLSNCDSATYFYIKSLQIAEATKDSLYAAKVMNNIAACYKFRGNPVETIQYYEKALSIFLKKKDTLWIGNVSYNIANEYKDLKKYEKALENYHLSLQYFENQKDKPSMGLALTGIGTIMEIQEKHDEAMQFFVSAEKNIDSIADPTAAAILWDNMATVYSAKKEYATAIQYLTRSNKVLLKVKSFEHLVNNFAKLSEIKELMGDYAGALADLKQKNMYADSLFSNDKDAHMLDMIKKYEADKKQNEIELLSRENQLKDAQINKIILALLGLIVILGLGYYAYYQKQKNNQQLSEKNAIISKALNDKDILLREIHHRVKNNLQVISSLLNLQSKHIQDKQALGAIKEGRDRVRSMAMIHQNLYREENLMGIDIGEYIQQLAENLFSSYNIEQSKVGLSISVDKMNWDVDDAIPLGLILNELISNALKYAFQEKENGVLTIALKTHANKVTLMVKDNGPGLPEGWSIDNQQSFGYQMIKSFAKKMKANLEMKNENGLCVSLAFPNIKTFDTP